MADNGEVSGPDATPRREPKVFTRVISTPPGMPWRQARMADLEARQSAPLPLSDVTYRVRRLGLWDGRAARFAAFYVRSADFTETFVAEAAVDGDKFKLRMVHPSEDRRRASRAATLGLTAAVLTIVLAAGLTSAGAHKQRLSETLDQAEQQASSRQRQAGAIHRRTQEATLLASAAKQDLTVDNVVADLNWVAANRNTEARVQAFHWQNGALAVEALGPNPPIDAIGRPLQRSAKPVRPGIWAWVAARPDTIRAVVSRPVSSDLK